MKCLCGYEKIGEIKVQVPAKDILYISGKRKGLKMKTLVSILVVAASLAACSKPPEASTSAGKEFVVEKLFTHEGCTVYRFSDDRTVYYTKCGEEKISDTSWTTFCGKGCSKQVNVSTRKD